MTIDQDYFIVTDLETLAKRVYNGYLYPKKDLCYCARMYQMVMDKAIKDLDKLLILYPNARGKYLCDYKVVQRVYKTLQDICLSLPLPALTSDFWSDSSLTTEIKVLDKDLSKYFIDTTGMLTQIEQRKVLTDKQLHRIRCFKLLYSLGLVSSQLDEFVDELLKAEDKPSTTTTEV